MTTDLRLGDWRDVLADVTTCHSVICDCPYSERTHAGHDDGADQVRGATGQKTRRDIAYASWTHNTVRAFVSSWAPRISRWFVSLTDDVLAPVWRQAYEDAGLYAFATVPAIVHRPRLLGDGPGCSIICVMVARPRTKQAMRWRCLPGWYPPTKRELSPVVGNKSSELMRAIVRDYSNEGDTIVDPCAGSGTTLLAAAQLGRHGIGAEIDPETHAYATERLGRQIQPEMFG